MPLSIVPAALSSIKAAIDISSFIAKSDSSLDKALLKVKIEEIVDSLSDAKKCIRNMEDIIYEKDKEIKLLKEKMDEASENVGYLGARYNINAEGVPTGTAYCPTCWASSKKLIPLVAWSVNEATHKCGGCGNTVQSRMAPLNIDEYIKSNKESAIKMNMEFKIDTYK